MFDLSLLKLDPYLSVAAIAFLINIPLGYIRENHPRFSFQWFLWIHASIPLLAYLRIKLDDSFLFIFVSIFCAVVAQILGGCWRLSRMSLKDKESLQQIPSEIQCVRRVDDCDVVVVLLNMGGPRTNADVGDFQKRLFSDRRLIRFPLGWAFQKLFASLLVFFRSKEAQKRYELIGGGSPILESTRNQTLALEEELKRRGHAVEVIFSFNYSAPFPDETIVHVKKLGKKYLLPVSLYPHYSEATTGSNLFYLRKSAQAIYPQLTILDSRDYYLHDQYIQAFIDRIHQQIGPSESLDDFYLLFSAHGLPLYFLKEGDLYPFQISQTVAKILTQLHRQDYWSIAYQSAVGPLQWLKPSTDDMITTLARRGVRKMIIIPVSFVTDHIETTCEIDMEYRQMAQKAGIKDFRMSKAIECHPGFIQALADTVEKSLNMGKSDRNATESSQTAQKI